MLFYVVHKAGCNFLVKRLQQIINAALHLQFFNVMFYRRKYVPCTALSSTEAGGALVQITASSRLRLLWFLLWPGPIEYRGLRHAAWFRGFARNLARPCQAPLHGRLPTHFKFAYEPLFLAACMIRVAEQETNDAVGFDCAACRRKHMRYYGGHLVITWGWRRCAHRIRF